jgi:hypothetical protein
MATNTKTTRRRSSSGTALARLWGIRALVAAAVGVAIGAGTGVMTVNRLEPGRADSVDSLAVMLDSISKGRIPDAKPAGAPTVDATPAPDSAAQEPVLVSVPAVTDLEEGDARNAILDAGLQVGEVQFRPSPKPAGIVLGTFPVSGARVLTKSAVSLVLSDGRDPADTLQQQSLR